MALITTIAGVPLFSTLQEALAWASSMGLSGYHTHSFQGQVGYMGGATHLQATGLPANSNAPAQPNIPPPTTNTPASGGTSGGGGGGGY